MNDTKTDESPLWRYSGTDGPEEWHSFCAIGEEQSPIDIVGPKTAELPEISFSYSEEPLRLYNHNHTVKAGPFENSFLTYDKVEYRLNEFHFHSPSEHLVNSKVFPLEAHLVHTADGGEHLVLSVFIAEGSARKDFNPLIESFERFALTKEAHSTLLVDPFDFIPPQVAYYTYTGSLTSPPCIQGVKWLILRDPFGLPGALVERLRRVVGENSRPVQPLNGRVVEASF